MATNSTDDGMCEAKVCEPGGKALLLPLFGEAEQEWPMGLRAILYFMGLLWVFLGVAIVSDVFMSAIETITSKKRRVVDPKTGKGYTYKVWNATVSNLTLMALGSSAPEILLSVIELFSSSMYSGALGPSTIVGSAAFNLFVITAVCVMAIPNGEIRKIKETPVFAVTASFSILAYLWLLIIVSVSSKDVIEIWEGVVTFLLFPVLVILAFLADKGYLKCGRSEAVEDEPAGTGSEHVWAEMTKEELAAAEMKLRKEHGLELSDEQIAKLLGMAAQGPKSKAAYRVESTRAMLGGRRAENTEVPNRAAEKCIAPNAVVPIESSPAVGDSATSPAVDCVVAFAAKNFAVKECVGAIKMKVRRTGDSSIVASVDYATRDGKAKAKSDYEPVSGTLRFGVAETEKHIEVKIYDDQACEEDEDFFIDLSNATCEKGGSIMIGASGTARVIIIDDDCPGMLSFEEDSFEVKEDTEDKIIQVTVKRTEGSNGKVGCKFYTEQGTATQGYDYLHTEGEITLDDGVLSAEIPVTICAKGRYEGKEDFRLFLADPTGGAKFDKTRDGGEENNIATIVIVPDEACRGKVDRVYRMMYSMDLDRAALGRANWKEQIVNAVLVNGGDDEVDPGLYDWFMHVASIFWKVLFALIPPTDYCGGWLCFFSALIMIGLVTAVVGDLASLLGCVIGIPDSITAITLVALGTSLPDTFASKAAAEQDPYADASVGNVTGSNSVNVFLGLGLPWTIGAIYWASIGRTQEWLDKYSLETRIDWDSINQGSGKFVVVGGDLGFSVGLFSGLAVVCMVVLGVRRMLFGGELGGPSTPKVLTAGFLVLLWVTYVSLSAWNSLQNIGACD